MSQFALLSARVEPYSPPPHTNQVATMAGITLAQAQAQLDAYLAAETAALAKKSYTIAGRTLTYQDLKAIQEGIELWSRRVGELNARANGRGRARTLVVR